MDNYIVGNTFQEFIHRFDNLNLTKGQIVGAALLWESKGKNTIPVFPNRKRLDSGQTRAKVKPDKRYTERLIPTLSEQVRQTALALSKRLGIKALDLQKSLGYWLKRVPSEEREDVLQLISIKLLENQPKNNALAFACIRGDVKNWWQAYKIRQHQSLESLAKVGVRDESREQCYQRLQSDTITGCCEYETIDSNLNASRIWNSLPDDIKPIISKRLQGKRLNGAERVRLHRFDKMKVLELV